MSQFVDLGRNAEEIGRRPEPKAVKTRSRLLKIAQSMDLRPYIRGTLWAGGLLVIALVVSGVLGLILDAVGDQPGSQGTKGELQRPNAGPSHAQHDPQSKSPDSDGHTSSEP
jgi:hypothetical protein